LQIHFQVFIFDTIFLDDLDFRGLSKISGLQRKLKLTLM